MEIVKKISELLLTSEKYQAENADGQKVLNKTLVSAHAREYNADLLAILQSDEDVKNHFFVKVNETIIFKLENFLTFISNRSFLPDSFTAFKNKIGLATDKENYLINSRDVVLNWAYKDCILEGGQTKDDQKQKRKEVFFNEILASDQINRLLDDKVFTNFKRYDKNGEHEVTELKKNDNLIIKGNNLVVLYSLKKRLAGKIKLIYIDPPYNTGKDSFGYNDKFKHSSWLTFMKNRLEVAKDLLADDGVIFVQCDDNEQAYLKVLMDEIFKRENFLANMVRSGKAGGGHDSQYLAVEFDYILVYCKKMQNFTANKMIVSTEEDKKYKLEDEYVAKRGKYYLRDLDYAGSYSPSLDYPIQLSNGKEIYAGGKFGTPNTWRWSKQKYEWGLKNGFIVVNEKKEKIYIKQYQYVDNEDNFRIREIPFRGLFTSLNTEGTKEINQLFDTKVFAYPKPENLIKYILEIATKEHDIVLDYHLGSGTTCAVAHKMNRQYIGIEQMDYIETISIERMKKVINGEDNGISKSVNWQGGGEFVYCELANDAENFRNEVRNANAKELASLLEKAKKSSFLSYRVDRDKFNGFENLTEQEQRKLLLQLVDANTLYVNYTDIESKDYEISEADKKLNKQFYGK